MHAYNLVWCSYCKVYGRSKFACLKLLTKDIERTSSENICRDYNRFFILRCQTLDNACTQHRLHICFLLFIMFQPKIVHSDTEKFAASFSKVTTVVQKVVDSLSTIKLDIENLVKTLEFLKTIPQSQHKNLSQLSEGKFAKDNYLAVNDNNHHHSSTLQATNLITLSLSVRPTLNSNEISCTNVTLCNNGATLFGQLNRPVFYANEVRGQ